MPVVVVATITPKPGMLEEVEAAFTGVIPQVHDEPGCELYALHRSGAGTLVMIEKWADAAALEAHRTGPALGQLGSRLGELTEGGSNVTLLDAVPAGSSAKGVL